MHQLEKIWSPTPQLLTSTRPLQTHLLPRPLSIHKTGIFQHRTCTTQHITSLEFQYYEILHSRLLKQPPSCLQVVLKIPSPPINHPRLYSDRSFHDSPSKGKSIPFHLQIPSTKRSARQQIHLRYMYLKPHANDLRHQPPLELQPFRIARKPCSPYFSSNG